MSRSSPPPYGPHGFAYARPFELPPVPLSQRQPYGVAGIEPGLCDMLADPLVHLVMRRDGVSPAALKAVIILARAKLGAGHCDCLAA
ncbi:MAG: hypothetical protein ABSG66_09150 [Stellaceae bacterium]|jgi:hypothetical protein